MRRRSTNPDYALPSMVKREGLFLVPPLPRGERKIDRILRADRALREHERDCRLCRYASTQAECKLRAELEAACDRARES